MSAVKAASALTIFRPARRSSRESVHFIKRVTGWSSSDNGEEIQLEATASDGSLVILQMDYRHVPKFLHAAIQAASIAEQIRELISEQGAERTSPYIATNFRPYIATGFSYGVSVDGKYIGLNFTTKDGVQVLVALSPYLPQETISRLSEALERLKAQPIPEPS
jgi:hypothetical protein